MRQLILRNFPSKKDRIVNGEITAFLHYLNPQPPEGYFYCGDANRKEMFTNGDGSYFFTKKLYHPGEIIYIREGFAESTDDQGRPCYLYRADGNAPDDTQWKWATKMPYAAARFFLQITSTEIVRFSDLTGDAAKALGSTGKAPAQKAREEWDNEVYHKREYMKSDRDPWLQLVYFRTTTRPEPEAAKKTKHISTRTYTVRLASTGEIVVSGTSRECAKALGCSTIGEFYDLAARILSGSEPKYTIKNNAPD